MLLTFDKPKKLRSTKEHNDLNSSDSGVAGTYVPNMSRKDQERWKGKHIRVSSDPRVEIRKTAGCQMLIVVRPDGSIRMSLNGPAEMDSRTFSEFNTVISEALKILREK